MDVGNGVNQLQHELPDVLRLQRAGARADRAIQVTPRAELEDEIDMGIGLEGVNQIDDITVGAEVGVTGQLLRPLIDRKGGVALGDSRFLGEHLDGDVLVGVQVPGHEDHTEGAMIKRRESLEASIKDDSVIELVLHAFHVDDLGVLKVRSRGELTCEGSRKEALIRIKAC